MEITHFQWTLPKPAQLYRGHDFLSYDWRWQSEGLPPTPPPAIMHDRTLTRHRVYLRYDVSGYFNGRPFGCRVRTTIEEWSQSGWQARCDENLKDWCRARWE